jgi:hypothetical protein
MWRLEIGILVLILVIGADLVLCSETFQRWCERLDRRWRLL